MTVHEALALPISLALGGVFLASALPKLRDPRRFVLAVLDYRVLPPAFGRLYARLIPPIELLAALLLLVGIAVRPAALLAALLLVSFIVAVGLNIARGRTLACGCFGAGGTGGTGGRHIGWRLLLDDGALLAMACVLVAVADGRGEAELWSPLRMASGAHLWIGGAMLWGAGVAMCMAILVRVAVRQSRQSRLASTRQPGLMRRAVAWVARMARGTVTPNAPTGQHTTHTRQSVEPAPMAELAMEWQVAAPAPRAPLAADGSGDARLATLNGARLATLNGLGSVDLTLPSSGGGMLLIFLSPRCAACQRLVVSLNAVAHQARFHGAIIVVLRGDEATARTFLSVFPLVSPAVCDSLGVLAQELDVRETPSALLFDSAGQLVRREHPIMHALEEFIGVPEE